MPTNRRAGIIGQQEGDLSKADWIARTAAKKGKKCRRIGGLELLPEKRGPSRRIRIDRLPGSQNVLRKYIEVTSQISLIATI